MFQDIKGLHSRVAQKSRGLSCVLVFYSYKVKKYCSTITYYDIHFPPQIFKPDWFIPFKIISRQIICY